MINYFKALLIHDGRSQWPRGQRRRSKAVRLLGLSMPPPGAWTFVCCECCVLWGTCLCDELITRPEESYRLWCVAMCDLQTSWMRRPWPTGGCRAKNNQTTRGYAVAQLVEALSYKLECPGLDSRWYHWNFHWHNPSGRTMTLGLIQPLTEMSTRNFPGGKGARCVGLTTLPLSCADCLEIWKPQPPRTLRNCPGI